MANIAAYNNNLKTKVSPKSNESREENLHLIKKMKKKKICLLYFNLDNVDYGRFVYLSYSKMNEKWNVINAI